MKYKKNDQLLCERKICIELKTHTYVPHNFKHSLGGWTRKLRPISQLNTADRINCFVYFPAKNLLKRKKKVAKETVRKVNELFFLLV